MERTNEVAPREAEVPMVEQEVVRQMRVLAAAGWGAKRIAGELGLARNTVRRYLRHGETAALQVRPGARCLDEPATAKAVALFKGDAEGNAVVVQQLLAQDGVEASVRTVQRAVEGSRREARAEAVATVRFETAPGRQLQIDFGEKKLRVGSTVVKVYLLVAVLSHSRRLFVKAFLNQRGDDWREGVAEAFRHFGGVPDEVLGDNAKPLVTSRDREAGTVCFHPAWLAFCREWDVQPRACGPYRARTKGKTESGVKYVKRNALAGRGFGSFGELEAHLAQWMVLADQREHGTTHEQPCVRFERDEKAALRPLPARPHPVRRQLLQRRVANDAFVDIDTVRYSVPYKLVRAKVEVHVGDDEVRIFHGATLVATHRRSFEPHARVVDPAHTEGLWRHTPVEPPAESPPEVMGRSLRDYEAVLERGAA